MPHSPHVRSRVLVPLLLLMTSLLTALGLAPGCSGGGTGGTGGGAGNACTGDLASIQETILTPSCAKSSCHTGAQPAADLDLSAISEAALVNVPSTTCPEWRLVVPGSPSTSLLHEKLGTAPPCGASMPVSGSLSADQIACIADWISAIVPSSDGGMDGCTTCGVDCVDVATDPAHCGTCDHACAAGEICNAGACACPPGQVPCGGSCVDTSADVTHCGDCNTACPPGAACDAGGCACGGSLQLCSGDCVDTDLDTNHCGACGQSDGRHLRRGRVRVPRRRYGLRRSLRRPELGPDPLRFMRDRLRRR
jgi:hypothetical protein